MEPRYREAIHNASTELCQALMQDVPALLQQGLRLDALVRDVLRAVALALLSALYQGLCRYLVEQAAALAVLLCKRVPSCVSRPCMVRSRWNPPTCVALKVVNRPAP